MHLKSLTLKGFKSFAQPTTFQFETGVTCVVGPNGSGKSNVVDALAWVMGEQGAKTLRGGKMEDVIFAGTSTRGPLGRAEVTLTIDNADGALPIDYTEVAIRRTLFRNGGSEYAINGTSCRLLDVQELLSDSGLGREMHVIVGQGRLDNVLRATPEERRGFIEEAAGILKHRRRKERTLRKLEGMQANLTRLNDLAGEIRRQLKPLGRQAEVARQAQTVAAVVRDARARLVADEVVTLRRALAEHTRTEEERTTERMVLQEKLDRAVLRSERIVEEQEGDEVDGARRTAFALEQVQERLRNLLSLAQQRLALLGSADDAPETAAGTTPGQVQESRDEAERLVALIAEAEAGWASARQATAAARQALDALDEEIQAQSALVSRHDLEIAGLTGRAETAGSRLAAVRGEVLRQQNALDAARARLAAAEAERERGEAEGEADEQGGSELTRAYEDAQADVASEESAIEAVREELHAKERERDALAAREQALASALDQRDGSSDLVAAGMPGVRGLLAEHVHVQPGYEAAVAAALGSLADAVLAETHDDAVAALRRAVDDDLGRVEVVVAGSADGRVAEPTGGAPGPVPVSSVVDAPDGVRRILAGVVVVDDLAQAVELARSPGSPATVITRGGDVVSAHVLRGGSGATRSKLELVAAREAAAATLTGVRARIDDLQVDLAAGRERLRAARERASAALGGLREADARLAAHAERLSRSRAQAESAAAELARVQRGLDLASASVEEAVAANDAARRALDEARSRPRPVLDASGRDALVAEWEAAREAEIEARLQVETARERVRAEQERTVSLERRLAAERAAAEEAARRQVIRRRQIARAASVADALPAVVRAADRSTAEARLVLARAEESRAGRNAELAALRREEAELRERLHGITEDVHGLELQIYEKRLQVSQLLERAASELGLGEEVLVAEYGPDVPVPEEAPLPPRQRQPAATDARDDADADQEEDGQSADTADDATPDADRSADPAVDDDDEPGPTRPFDREEQKARLQVAERKLAQLGRVNPLALEEFAALEQRHLFLTEQLADLTATRKDLLTIIDDIDRTMQGVFAAAFEDTRQAFDRVFPILFPGGTGSIHLTDPEQLLTTGIEVSVRPAGKRIERLSLLSGGERSLAAVALLIAIFTARPSPFYIMDEVEAALDDANLGRLLTILEQLRDTSQLIVITHQKRTMEIADALYGVSMRQDGVSAVVGQRVSRDARTETAPGAAGEAAPEPAREEQAAS
ncbi:chromosome segregation protein SMC [Clavibacter sepedonicus]|uniref:Chromosome partition protein Smc n=3 Tax=Clavibacter TaxID=1573 RepID=B0REM2_CLASE|nr:chromosome segregation protein SMC [Clavibacter sepedonicus]OQJ49237.1 chromosome segregation protein SMC [Clavibacter sepedonicus]OQJ54849.1 chromosome segregation protein SMC [Clavibacter sepedonicus]UUK64922.1 chromosome segregation protein SMC [Clavibacter sepedonicus]CAQ00869.1 putative chromosome structure maintenance protein [Clavibacter sepedonicus]